MDHAECISLCKNDNVLCIEIADFEGEDLLYHSKTHTGSYAVDGTNGSGYTGAGIKLGMLEMCVPNTNIITLGGVANKTHINNNSYYYDDHANRVASIMVGQGDNALPFPSKGFAYGFSDLYCIGAGIYFSVDKVEWLLDQGVNIINISYGTNESLGQYTLISAWFDHIAYNHSVHVVFAAGNDGKETNHDINQFAMSYNTIAVGFMNCCYPESSMFHIDPRSSYNTGNKVYKPDISAPGKEIAILYSDTLGTDPPEISGSSYAAPMVSGSIAQLCEYEPYLLLKQALVKSILSSGVLTQTRRNYETSDTDYRIYGSGMLHVANAMTLTSRNCYVNSTISSSQTYKIHSMGYLNTSSPVNVSLAFLKRSRFTSGTHTTANGLSQSGLANLDIYIYKASDTSYQNPIDYSISTVNNVEKLVFTPPTNGEYVIKVNKVYAADVYDIIYGVSWYQHGATPLW